MFSLISGTSSSNVTTDSGGSCADSDTAAGRGSSGGGGGDRGCGAPYQARVVPRAAQSRAGGMRGGLNKAGNVSYGCSSRHGGRPRPAAEPSRAASGAIKLEHDVTVATRSPAQHAHVPSPSPSPLCTAPSTPELWAALGGAGSAVGSPPPPHPVSPLPRLSHFAVSPGVPSLHRRPGMDPTSAQPGDAERRPRWNGWPGHKERHRPARLKAASFLGSGRVWCEAYKTAP